MKGDIRLEGVDFGYFDDRMVLHNVDVYANPGEKIAILFDLSETGLRHLVSLVLSKNLSSFFILFFTIRIMI